MIVIARETKTRNKGSASGILIAQVALSLFPNLNGGHTLKDGKFAKLENDMASSGRGERARDQGVGVYKKLWDSGKREG